MIMDNSILSLIDHMRLFIGEVQRFKYSLRHHVIIEPKNRLEDAARNGLPEEFYRRCYYYIDQNESQTEDVIRNNIDNKFLPYLQNVLLDLENALNVGTGGAMMTSVPQNTSSTSGIQGSSSSLSPKEQALDKNNKDLEKALGIKQGPKMSIEKADKQNANPHLIDEFIEDPNGDFETINGTRYSRNPEYSPNDKEYYEQFKVNCATCATAYALRLRGFDVKAKGNVIGSGSLNEKISNAREYLNVWKNADGTKAEIVHTDDWMKKNGIKKMTTDDYRNYFEETCKEKGVYVVMVRWKGESSGHATILHRDTDGVLYYIEPQRYEMSRGADGRRSLDDLLMMHDGTQKLSPKPSHGYGVMRVDDKIFNTDYANLFEI